jgi:hypothetical protein
MNYLNHDIICVWINFIIFCISHVLKNKINFLTEKWDREAENTWDSPRTPSMKGLQIAMKVGGWVGCVVLYAFSFLGMAFDGLTIFLRLSEVLATSVVSSYGKCIT